MIKQGLVCCFINILIHLNKMQETKSDYFFKDLNKSPCPSVFKKSTYPWEALLTKNELLNFKKSEIKGKIASNVAVSGPVICGENTIIEPGSVLEGPIILGKNCLIRPHVWIRKNSIVGNNCVVGHGVELKNSIVFDQAKIGTNCFVGDSILGCGARVGSGSVLGNRRFDQKIIQIKIEDKVFSTDTDKFGATLGDFCRLGTGVLTSPGTLVGMHTWVYGGALLSGFIPKDTLVKVRQKTEMILKERVKLKEKDLSGAR
jgi:bifunctional UDP-N-acetylglucosamine pyrophosphorylase/glucosamine-1-phosphate N-acetyltransferase